MKVHHIVLEEQTMMAVEMVRDLFGSILFLALQRKIDMAEVLSFPLTPTPLYHYRLVMLMELCSKHKKVN